MGSMLLQRIITVRWVVMPHKASPRKNTTQQCLTTPTMCEEKLDRVALVFLLGMVLYNWYFANGTDPFRWWWNLLLPPCVRLDFLMPTHWLHFLKTVPYTKPWPCTPTHLSQNYISRCSHFNIFTAAQVFWLHLSLKNMTTGMNGKKSPCSQFIATLSS